MTEHDPSQALLHLYAEYVTADLHDVVTSIETVREQGHYIGVDQVWLDQQHAELHSSVSIGSERIPTQRLTPGAIEELSKIELNRYDSVAYEWLPPFESASARSISYLREQKVPEDQIYHTVAAELLAIGGVVVVTGTELAIHASERRYRALREKRIPQGRARFPYH